MDKVKKDVQTMKEELELELLDEVSGGSLASGWLAIMAKVGHNGCKNQAQYDDVKKAVTALCPGAASDADFIKVDNYFQGLLNKNGHIVNDDAEAIIKKHGKGFVLNM